MKKIAFLIIGLVVVLASGALAQDDEYYVKDVMEVNFFGGIGIPTGDISNYSDTAGAGNGFNLGFDAGYFITFDWVAGLDFTYTQFPVEKTANAEGLHHRLYSPSLYLKYYFNGGSDWIPYLKVHAGIDFPKFATFVTSTKGNRYREISFDPVFAYGIGAGLFKYTSDFSGLFVEVNYHRAISKDATATFEDVDYKFNDNLATVDVHGGIRILIGPSQ